MLTPGEIWPILAGSAAVVFGAGQIVEKIRNGKYVNREFCGLMHKNLEASLKRMERNQDKIWRRIDGQPDREYEEDQ